nr:translocation/assembly module TamB domain-containing protein [uncultured Aquabacterium sp.]
MDARSSARSPARSPARLVGSFLLRVVGAALSLLLLVAALLGGAWALAHGEWLTGQVLTRLPGVTVVAPRGALLGDFEADRIEVSLPREGRLVLVAPRWQGLRFQVDRGAPWWLGLRAEQLAARRVDVNWVAAPPDPKAPPAQVPTDLRLPVSLTVAALRVDELRGLTGTQPLTGLSASLRLGPMRHEVRLGQLAWSGWTLSGLLGVGATQRLPLEVDLQAVGERAAAARPGSVEGKGAPDRGELSLRLRGPLDSPDLVSSLRWSPAEGAPQSLDATAALKPFAPWPLAAAQLQLRSLDLSALAAGLPQTRLTGAVSLRPEAAAALRWQVNLDNPAAGAWDARRLPLASLQGTWRLDRGQQLKALADLWQPGALELSASLPGDLADLTNPTNVAGAQNRRGTAASLSIEGPWGGAQPLRLRLRGVSPQALHGAAPALRLDGVFTLQVEPGANWRATLGGEVDGLFRARGAGAAMQKVSARLRSVVTARDWRVAELLLTQGAAQARLSEARVQWGGEEARSSPTWSAQGQLSVTEFDPRVWMPWPAGMAGRNSLSGQGRFALDSAWLGELSWQMLPSVLAGLPLQADLSWRSPANARSMSFKVMADVAGNQVRAEGVAPRRAFAASGPHPADPADSVDLALAAREASWQAQVAAPQLKALSPLGPLLGWRQLDGEVQADVRAQGMWPPQQLQGQVRALSLSVQPLSGPAVTLASAQGEAAIDLRQPNAPLRMNLQAQGLKVASVRVEQARLELDGTAAAHRLSLQAAGQVQNGSGSGSGTGSGAVVDASQAVHLNVALTGAWSELPSVGARGASTSPTLAWKGRLQEAQARFAAPPERPPLLQVQPMDLSWQRGPTGQRLNVQATRLQLMGADVALERLSWSSTDEVDVSARLEPLAVAPWLARWQPQAGWGGDLLIGGRLRVHHSLVRPWEVDVELARLSGDLSFSEATVEGSSAQRLGLRDASFVLQARDGVWTAQQKLDGRVLGLLTGRQQVQAASASALPDGASAVSGELALQVSNLRPLAAWLPAGWRLSGAVQAQARWQGTLAQPRLSGWVEGSQLGLSQSILGVHLTDGRVRLEIEGDRVSLVRLEALDGGKGSLRMQGEMQLTTPLQARLSAQAERFAALQRVDRRIVLSGDAAATLAELRLEVRGRVKVDEGLIDISRSSAPTLGDDVSVRRRGAAVVEQGGVAAPGAGGNGQATGQATAQSKGRAGRPAPTHQIDAQIALDLGNRLRLMGHGLDGMLVGQLSLTTPQNKPAIHGSVRVDKGTFAAYGQKLDIQRSNITFTGLVENPRLDILAMRPQSPAAQDSDVKVGVRITGSAQDPRVRLYSEPSLSETEQLSWLVLGRGPSGLGGADIGLLQSAAVALLSGDGNNAGPTDRIIALLGLDDLSVRQTDGAVRDTVVNVGKQISRFWYVGYERNLSATGGNWQLIYSLARRFKLRAQAGEDNAVDLIWQWRWD